MTIKDIENKYKILIDEALKIINELNEPVHGIGHIKGVVENTILLLQKEPNANKEVCILSAYWHDVGRKYGKKEHGLKSAEMLKARLICLNYDSKFIDSCYHAIYMHDSKNVPDTLEGIIIKDADKLDNLGLKRWQECINNNVRPPRVILNLKQKLFMEHAKEIYNKKALEWLEYLKQITLESKN